MDISRLDYWAASGKSRMHASALLPKVAGTVFVVACVVVSRDLAVLLLLYALVLITVRAAGLPLLSVVAISLFPALFSVLYAVSQAGQGWALPVVIVLKAVTAATAMILLISTTPFAEVAGFLGRSLPKVVADGLFMTYRSFFMLLELADHFIKALKLRGGFQPRRLVRNAGNLSSGVGMLFIHAYDKSQRLYDVMSLRGYSGRLTARRHMDGLRAGDLPYPVMALVVLGCAAYIRASGKGGCTVALAALLLVYFAGMEASRAWKRS